VQENTHVVGRLHLSFSSRHLFLHPLPPPYPPKRFFVSPVIFLLALSPYFCPRTFRQSLLIPVLVVTVHSSPVLVTCRQFDGKDRRKLDIFCEHKGINSNRRPHSRERLKRRRAIGRNCVKSNAADDSQQHQIRGRPVREVDVDRRRRHRSRAGLDGVIAIRVGCDDHDNNKMAHA
jgi:hypothetical protein